MKKLKSFLLRFKVWHIGMFLLAIAIAFIIRDPTSFIANIGTELFSISITILVIDMLVQNHERHNLKTSLISQMRSEHNILASDAVRRLRLEGWIGELQGILLSYANLEGVDLSYVNLKSARLVYSNLKSANVPQSILDNVEITETNFQNAVLHNASFRNAQFFAENPGHYLLKDADLINANFEGATFKGVANGEWSESEHVHLQEAKRLCGAIMPNGKKYNGRYFLQGDIADAQNNSCDLNDDVSMANFYGVSLDEYQSGREWNKKYGKSPADLIAWN